MDTLLMEPAKLEEENPQPVVSQPHVQWLKYRHAVIVYYFNAETQKMSSRSMKVEVGSPEFVQSKVDVYAQILEDFYAVRHNQKL